MSKRRSIPRKLEKQLFQEAASRCLICGTQDVAVLTVHHIIPVAENPEHDLAHMLVLCANCHAKADKGELTRESLYSAKSKASNARFRAIETPSVQQQSVSGVGNVVAGGHMNIQHLDIRVNQGRPRSSPIIIPGTVG